MVEDNKNLYLLDVTESPDITINIMGNKITKSEKQQKNYELIKNQFSLFCNYPDKEISDYTIKIADSKQNVSD